MTWKEADEVLKVSDVPTHLKQYDAIMREKPKKHHKEIKTKKSDLFIKDIKRFKNK